MKNKIIKDKNFDYMTILVKGDSINIAREYYQSFSWEIFDEHKYGVWGNTIALELRRPHDILNKDKLQYLQVQMEFNLNEQAKLDKNKHNKSIRTGFIFCLLCAVLFATSIIIFIKNMSVVMNCLAVFLLVVGLVLVFLTIYMINNIYKKETEIFCNKTEKIFEVIDKICEKVRPNK